MPAVRIAGIPARPVNGVPLASVSPPHLRA